ncbi:hypothetical protein VTI74DRAFT_116 [Chaetomium olivicolor]
MVHRTSNADPPDHLFRDRNLTTSRESQPSLAPTAHSEPTPVRVQDPQNEQKSKTRSRLEFHRTAHSFPDYGSVKGAVRMPLPSQGFMKGIAPRMSMNTLSSSPSCPAGPRQTATTLADLQPPAPKRQKVYTTARFKRLDEEIVDLDQDALSRTERRGSQSSFAHSTSPGLSEYQTVEASTRFQGRSNRRRRRGTNRPPLVSHERRRDTESIESLEDIAPASKPAAHQQRTARLISTTGPRFTDAADEGLLEGVFQPEQRFQGPKSAKKRSSYEITNDADELGEAERDLSSTVANSSTDKLARRCAPSLSRRGDMNLTKWSTKSATSLAASGVRVESAVCEPNLRWDGQTPCVLRQTNGSELRAFTDDGAPAESYGWLKIAGKAKTLTFHPETNIIKVTQATDQSSSTPIGRAMTIKFRSCAEALRVAEWAQNHLGIRVTQESDMSKLPVTHDKLFQEITRARVSAPAKRSFDETSAHPPRAVGASPTADGASQSNGTANSRISVRAQMRISDQQAPSSVLAEHSSAYAPASSRSLRTRLVGHAQNFGAPVTRRWSEDHTKWLEDWKMPLLLNRTTVNKEDIPRLDEGECLNDNLIGYGLRYLFDKLESRHPDLHKRVYLHNSFFYEKLKAGRGAINYDGVKSWTAKVDLLSYDYIVVPVNEHFHWWVAIICNPGKLDPDARSIPHKAEEEKDQTEGKPYGALADIEMTDATQKQALQSPRAPAADETELVKSDVVDLVSDDKNVCIDLTWGPRLKQNKKSRTKGRTYSPEDPRIITLDSLGGNHPQAISHLKKYLLAEFEHKRNKIIPDSTQPLGMKAVNLPEQSNLHDCGVYLLGYIQEFVKNPDLFIRTLLNRERPAWEFDASKLRELWRDTILYEQKMYQNEQLTAKQIRRGTSASSSTPNKSADPSHQASRETSAVTSTSNGTSAERKRPSELSKTSATPLNFEAGHVKHFAPHTPKPNGTHLPSSSATVSSPSHQRQAPHQSRDDEIIVLPPQEEEADAVIPSIESQEVEEIPRPPSNWPNDEPTFIAKLSSSTSSEPSDDDGHVTELSPNHFYASSVPRLNNNSNSPNNRGQKRTTMSSPTTNISQQRARAAKSHRAQTPPQHTTSQFVEAGSSPQRGADVPVVQKAELVRQSEPIDLT